MVDDRGNIKWNAMMLPEHVKLLKKYRADLNKVEKPLLDEQKYEEFNAIILKAINEAMTLVVTYYYQGKIKTLTGEIKEINQLTKEIQVYDSASHQVKINVNNILDIETYSK